MHPAAEKGVEERRWWRLSWRCRCRAGDYLYGESLTSFWSEVHPVQPDTDLDKIRRKRSASPGPLKLSPQTIADRGSGNHLASKARVWPTLMGIQGAENVELLLSLGEPARG
ncbi:unnamed protein product [Strongylus vulgaris]|uniref:Uncharacterized protein n=1 Tax=Strongylus vulgaris TaxID=40348 RepID=A0A3P7JD02_STRVU|nr:unnamed protein product [Strongylus vulgaris]